MKKYILELEDYPDLSLRGLHDILSRALPMVKPEQIKVKEIQNDPTIEIFLNGRVVKTNLKEMSYNDVVMSLANPIIKEGVVYSITYTYSDYPRISGILISGDRVSIRPGMVFNAFITGNA